MVASPGGCLTSLRSRGRRDHQTAVTKFSMSWTSEQNSTHWGGSLWRICSRPKTDKLGCTTGVRGCVNSRREIRYLYYFLRLLQNYSQSGKDPFWSHGEWGSSITRSNERIGLMHVRFITSTCSNAGTRGRTAPHRNAPRGGGAQPPLSPSGTQEKHSSGRVKGHAKLGRNRRIA